ncbi:hypothetical protein F383_26210 [Gossypium arboreum]|nr:hypothetical protein F383_26210 [Gossypium arboreum]
MSSTQLF